MLAERKGDFNQNANNLGRWWTPHPPETTSKDSAQSWKLVKRNREVTSGCESWTVNKAECWIIDALKLWCWRRLLRVPWTARRSKLSVLRKTILNIHCKDWRWSWSSNTLATRCKELTHCKRPSYWERLRAGEEGTTENEMVWWHYRFNRHGLGQNTGDGGEQGSLARCSPWGHRELDMIWQLNSNRLNASLRWEVRAITILYCMQVYQLLMIFL